MPRLSIVMPVRDVRPYVEAAVRSALAQTFTDFELIVIDDGSEDGTADVVAAIDDPRIAVHRTARSGLVAAENRGLELASGELVVRCDGDDLLLPALFERQVEILDREPRTAAVGAWTRQFGSRQSFRPGPDDPAAIRRRLRWANALSQPVMFRLAEVRELGGFRAVTWEDWDLWVRLSARHDVRNVTDCLVLLRSRPDSTYWTWSRVRVRRASLAMRLTAMHELGPSVGSLAAVATGVFSIARAAILDPLVPRRRPGSSDAIPPPISVVIPTYGRPELLLRCLDAVETQEPRPAEVVVVTRPEDEPTTAVLAGWASQDPERHRVIHVDRPGLVFALDAGTRAVRGDVVAYLDDDAIPRPGWIAELGLGLLDPTIGAVGGSLVDYVDGVARSGRTRRVGVVTWYGRIIGRHHLRTDHYGDVDWLTGSNIAVRTALARHDTGLVHASTGLALANDLDTSLSVRRAGYRVLFSPWAVVEHHTTSFRDPALGTRVAGPDVETSAANHTYALLKFLSPGRRAAFLGYAFAVGQASLPGPLRAVAEVPRSPARARAMAARIPLVWRGRRAGIEMWRRWRAQARSAPADPEVVP